MFGTVLKEPTTEPRNRGPLQPMSIVMSALIGFVLLQKVLFVGILIWWIRGP